MINSQEYKLTIENGEEIDVLEFPVSVLNFLKQINHPIIDRCSIVPRDVIEEAKRGGTFRFKKYLKSPISSLLKFKPDLCSHHQDCVLYKEQTCTTQNFSNFPICWTAIIEFPDLSETQQQILSMIINQIIHAWKDNKRVILANDD
jgi:hypothetical protein